MTYDITIVGGGLVGATLAALLGTRDMSVALVEARRASTTLPDPETDPRVSAITVASRRILDATGAWPRLALEHTGIFREMRVWDAQGSGSIHFDCARVGVAELGHIIANAELQRALDQVLHGLDTVDWYRPASLESVDVSGEKLMLGLDAGEIKTRLLVGADGCDSRVRALCELGGEPVSYGQSAVAANVLMEEHHRYTAWQCFLPTGPLAFLPLAGNRCAVVWSTEPETAQRLVAQESVAFAAALGEAFDFRLGRVLEVGGRGAFPLRSMHAERYVGARTALVGDAAHSIHPLAGQGLNLGLLDAAVLAEVVLETVSQGRDPGGQRSLRRYARWRRGHNALAWRAMGAFKTLFGDSRPGVRLARNLGLDAMDRLPLAKDVIMGLASGLWGDLPAAARGRGSISGG